MEILSRSHHESALQRVGENVGVTNEEKWKVQQFANQSDLEITELHILIKQFTVIPP